MKISSGNYIFSVLLAFFTQPITIFAQDIDFSNESEAKEILLGKFLNCQMDEQNYHGPELIKIDSVDGDAVTGSSNFCYRKTIYKGKLRKNTFKWVTTDKSPPCYSRTGVLVFSKDSNGQINAKGHYDVGGGSNTFRGTINCALFEY